MMICIDKGRKTGSLKQCPVKCKINSALAGTSLQLLSFDITSYLHQPRTVPLPATECWVGRSSRIEQ